MQKTQFHLIFSLASALQSAALEDLECRVATIRFESMVTPMHGAVSQSVVSRRFSGVAEIVIHSKEGGFCYLMGFEIHPKQGESVTPDSPIDFHLPSYALCSRTLYDFNEDSLFSLNTERGIDSQVADEYDALRESTSRQVATTRDYKGSELEVLLSVLCEAMNKKNILIPIFLVNTIGTIIKEQAAHLLQKNDAMTT